jgi:hypothetical protein
MLLYRALMAGDTAGRRPTQTPKPPDAGRRRQPVRSARRALALAAALTVTVAGGAAANPPPGGQADCTGYSEPRVFLESQSWWSDFEFGFAEAWTRGGEAQHSHSGVCVPLGQVVSGQVAFDVVTQLHNYPGQMLRKVRVQVQSDQDGQVISKTVEPRQVCSVADCTFVNRVTIDTDQLAAGMWEFRFHSEVRPGIVTRPANLATNGYQICVRSCVGRTPQATDFPEGRGWYRQSNDSVVGYINGRFDSMAEFPWRNGHFQTISGTWCPPVRVLRGSNEGQNPLDSSFVTVDPSFHHGGRGLVLLEAPGAFRGRVCVDTTRLADGMHKLLIGGYSTSFTSGVGQLWGTFVVPFRTANGAAPAPDPAPHPEPDPDPPPPPSCPAVTLTDPTAGEHDSSPVSFNASAPGASRIDYWVDGRHVGFDDSAGNGFVESIPVAAGSHTAFARATVNGQQCDSPTVVFSS